MNLRQELKRAICDGSVVPFFQPIVDLRSGTTTSLEILARWTHPRLGSVAPADFIPVAEHAGFMPLLTETMLRKVGQSWEDLPSHLSLSLNVSPTQLVGNGLLAMLETVAGETALPLNRLTLELTESALLRNFEEVQATLQKLKSAGCKLALDDFGTGYSSLTYLRSLPLDVLKIDQSFVRTMVSRREDRKIVGAVIGLGKSLNLKTVAEGIEERAQADMLLMLGCDCGQGWLYGKPVQREELAFSQDTPELQAPSSSKQADTIVCMEALPAQSYAQLRAIYNSAPVGLAFLDCNFRFVNANYRIAAIHGLSIEELVGRNLSDINPVRFSLIQSYLVRARGGETIENVEFSQPVFVHGDAQTQLVSFQPAMDEVGEVVGVLVSVLDISARKKAEIRAEEKHRYLESVLDALPIGVVIAEAPSGRIVNSNPCSKQILAQDPLCFEEISQYGERVAYYRNGLRLRSEDFPLARALQQGETTGPERLYYKTGQESGKWLELSGAPIRNNKGEIVGAVAALQQVQPHNHIPGLAAPFHLEPLCQPSVQ